MATAVGCVALRVTARAQVAQARRTAHGPVYELDTANTVASARLRSHPGDVAVFLTNRYPKGWIYYLRFYQGYDPVVQAAPPIASDRLVYLSGPSEQARLRGLLDGDPKISEVSIVAPINVRPERLDAVTRLLAGAGFRPRDRIRPPLSESVRRFTRG